MAVVLVQDSVVLEPAPYLTPAPLHCVERGRGEVYSVLRLFTGLLVAALMD